MTSEITVVSAKGLSTQRQLDALNSAPKYFSKHQRRTARVSTGITIEYVLHSSIGDEEPAWNVRDEQPPSARVVLVMGLLQTMDWWAGILDLVLDKYAARHEDVTVLAFNNRGVGASSAPWPGYSTSQMASDALALMDHIGWDTAHVVGLSMGGMIALELASLASQRVETLSLLVTTRGRPASDPRSLIPLSKASLSRDTGKAVSNLLELLYPVDAIRSGRIEETGESVYDALFKFHSAKHPEQVMPPVFGILGQTRALHTHFVSDERLAAIKRAGFPILIIGSMRDILIPTAESVKLKDRLDGDHVRTLFFANGGHGINIQYVDEVANALIATFKHTSGV